MMCWFCNRIFGKTDITGGASSPALNQTTYGCINCGAEFLVSEKVLREPTVVDYVKNEPHK